MRTPQNLDVALEAWSRRKWLALLVFAAVCGGAGTGALSLPDLYRATATVLVERQQVSEAFVRPSVTVEPETRLQTIREDVMSRTRLTDVIRRLDLYPELRQKLPIEALVARMRREIDLEVKGVESQMSGRTSAIAFTISDSGRDPQTVARVANELARMYVEENTKIREGQATRTAEFLKAQLDEVRKDLDAYERRANDFRLSHVGELPQQVETNLASLERLNTQLRLNGENQIRLMDRRERLERQRLEAAATPPPAPVAPSVEDERLAKLKQQLEDLRSRFTDAYPDVVRVRAEIDALTRQLARQAGTTPPSRAGAIDAGAQLVTALDDTTSELRSLKEEERMLRQTIDGYEQRVENAPRRQQEFQELSRDHDANKERYDTLLKRYEEAQLAASLEQGHNLELFRVLDPALPPREPMAPNRVRLFAIAFIFALGLAVGTVIAAEKLDTAFHDADELRAFISVPTLASVPLIASRAQMRRKRQIAALATLSALVALTLIVAGSRYVARDNEQIVRLMEHSRG
jgi:polysaccharide biosynthesis transport protein